MFDGDFCGFDAILWHLLHDDDLLVIQWKFTNEKWDNPINLAFPNGLWNPFLALAGEQW